MLKYTYQRLTPLRLNNLKKQINWLIVRIIGNGCIRRRQGGGREEAGRGISGGAASWARPSLRFYYDWGVHSVYKDYVLYQREESIRVSEDAVPVSRKESAIPLI